MRGKMMEQLLLLSVYAWSWMACQVQGVDASKLIPVSPLPKELTENSGLIEMDDDLFVGLNDSGSEPILYLFSIKRHSGTRMVKIKGAQNVDWEDLTADDTYVYIGDTGNNSGIRQDLTIYRVKKDDLRKNVEAEADKITYAYDGQTSFKSSSKNNFDCEALVCVGDSLYLFTKNRGNQKTDLYSLPKAPGQYKAKHLGQFEANGLITSAALRTKADKSDLVLIGYINKGHSYNGFMIYFPMVEGTHFFQATPKRVEFNTSLQIESVLYHGEHQVYISNEKNNGQEGLIYKADLLD
jgi:hypothetical protein